MNKQDVQQWIQYGPEPELVRKAEKFGRQLHKGKLTTSQIRQVFSKLKGIEAKGFLERRVDFIMLKPLMAYAASRQKATGLQDLKETVSWAIDEVVLAQDDNEALARFKNFCRFFEAVLAYHKAAGGK